MHNPKLIIISLLLILFLNPTNAQLYSTPLPTGLPLFLYCLPSTVPRDLPFQENYSVNLNKSFYHPDRTSLTPLAIITASKESDIVWTLRCAKLAKLQVCTRSGGHSLIGRSTCSGVLLDVGKMNSVKLVEGNPGLAEIEAGANLGEVLWNLHKGRKWMAAGVCPSVGVGGYVFGGGHGPYEGTLGMTCDSLEYVRLVKYGGEVVEVWKNKGDWRERELFWGLCGAGGGQLGVVSRFRMKVVDSGIYDRSVVFRFNWKLENTGLLMHRWMDYGEMNGKVWFRMEMGQDGGGPSGNETGMFGYGACYDVSGVKECMGRLNEAEFFNTPGRSTVFIGKMKNALDAHAFYGPEGDWGRKPAEDLFKAMMEQRYTEQGNANGRIYQSTFLRKKGRSGFREPPSVDFWQKYANFCAKSGLESIPWVVCELNLFNNAIDIPRNNAFAYREADIITHYIVGGGTEEDLQSAYNWMKNHFAPYTIGVYVNYPERGLGDSYARAYWGKNLFNLRLLRTRVDPDMGIANFQPIPLVSKAQLRYYTSIRNWFNLGRGYSKT